jgi:hypothetical protein
MMKNDEKKTDLAEGILAEDLLRQVVGILTERLNGVDTKLKEEVLWPIAIDPDPHKGTKTGYMKYTNMTCFKKGEKNWVLAFGTKTGDYPGDEFKCNILAFPFNHENGAKEFEAGTVENLFKYSLVVAMYTGQIMINKKITALIGKNDKYPLLSDVVYNSEIILMDGNQAIIREAIYEKGAAEYFSSKIMEYLSTV